MKAFDRFLRRVARKAFANEALATRAFSAINWRKMAVWRNKHPVRVSLTGPYDARYTMYDEVTKQESLNGPITYLEFGVYKGDSIKWWMERNRHPESRFVGFDSFEGLPEDWRPARQAGEFSTGGKPPVVEDPRCSFEVGWFNDTLPAFVMRFRRSGRVVVHCDADLYSSTLFVLASLASVLNKGDIIIFDELWDCDHEGRALLDFETAFKFRFEALVGLNGHAKCAMKIV